MRRSHAHGLALTAILVVYACLFARTIGYDYVWDDDHTLRDSDFFDRPLSEQLRVTEMQRIDPTVSGMSGIAPGHESYRPITLLSQDLDVRLFGRGSPAPMHVHNLILGALTILLVFWVSRRLFDRAEPALAVAAIFALHPLHVEPFSYISARADLVSGILGIAALALVIELAPPNRDPRRRWVRAVLIAGACVLFLASLFAKESTLGLPVVALVFALALGRVRLWMPALVALGATLVVYVLLRRALIPDATAATTSRGAIDGATALPSLVLQYFESFVVPFDISIARQPRFPAVVGWGVVIALAVGVVIAWRRRRLGPGLALAAAAVATSLLMFGPSAVAVSTLGAMACRYVYVPLLAFAIVAVLAAQTAMRRGGLLRTGTIAVAALWGALVVFVSHREIPSWASDEALYAHAVAVEPTSGIAQFHLGMLRYDAGQWEDAAALLERAVELTPTNTRALNNLSVCYMTVGRFDDAERVLRQALALTGGATFRPWYNLATIQFHRGEPAAACASLQRALAINPAYARARTDFDRMCKAR